MKRRLDIGCALVNKKRISVVYSCDTPGKSLNSTVYLASSVSAYQISGRNFFLVGDTVTTRISNPLLCNVT
ncbi:hypothetical protein Hdeb2414_s0005g00153321 [Helianthus debilis subsp. tardiflorus]